MGGISPERAGWSVAPEVGAGLARQKEQCDEMISQIRAGTFQQYYLYTFGKVERMWAYVCAVGRRANKERVIRETDEMKDKLLLRINEFNSLINQPEELDLLEDQRLRAISRIDGEIINLFVSFYQNTLDLGVEIGLFSFQKGGNWYPDKQERGMGVPLMP